MPFSPKTKFMIAEKANSSLQAKNQKEFFLHWAVKKRFLIDHWLF